MRFQEFNEAYNIEPTAKGLRAMPKRGKSGIRPEAFTADGEPFDASREYFHFESRGRAIRSTQSLRRIDDDWLGSLGMRIVEIGKLRANRDDAIDDGQKYFLAEIKSLREMIQEFEAQKEPKNRSLKAFLMAGK